MESIFSRKFWKIWWMIKYKRRNQRSLVVFLSLGAKKIMILSRNWEVKKQFTVIIWLDACLFKKKNYFWIDSIFTWLKIQIVFDKSLSHSGLHTISLAKKLPVLPVSCVSPKMCFAYVNRNTLSHISLFYWHKW